MTKSTKKYYRYGICFKEKVVSEVSSGSSISEVCRRYGITGTNTVQRWIKQFGRDELLNTVIRIEPKGERDGLKELESEVKKLKLLSADKTMEADALETLIKIANRHYDTDLKKNFGRQQSGR